MPDSSRGEYWFSIREGINHALEEFSDIRIDCSFSLYNRNDIHSCREVFGQVSVSDADAVIICATNREETVGMCRCLGNRNIPYFMAGTEIPDTDPVASFSADQEASGRLAARLLSTLSAPPPHQENTNGNFAVILPQQTAACNTGTFGERKRGITEYFSHSSDSLRHDIRKQTVPPGRFGLRRHRPISRNTRIQFRQVRHPIPFIQT